MTMKRKQSEATSRDGINFVRALVERQNSTFQEIDLHNDLGNDAYVEFVVAENATGCCVALQIKSGPSYRRGSRYGFQSDRDHFEYWASHTLPVIAVIFDTGERTAAWIDLTKYLREHQSSLEDGPYTVYAEQEFSDQTFTAFREHCLKYRDQHEPSFGRALQSFSNRNDIEQCFDGLKSLVAYHRNQLATWYYLISCLSNYRGHPILRTLVASLCHIPGHGDIFWSRANSIDDKVRGCALQIMKERFDRRDAITLLSAIDDAGIDRGTIGQCVHALVETMPANQLIMESLATDQTQDNQMRQYAMMLAVSAAQTESASAALSSLEKIWPLLGESELAAFASMLKEHLKEFGCISFY